MCVPIDSADSEAEDEVNKHEVHHIWQKVARDDVPVALPEGAGGGDVAALALPHRLPAHEAAEAHPAGDAEGDADAAEAGTEDEENGDEQENLGDAGEGAVEVLNDVVHPATEVSREDAKQRAERDVDGAGEPADDERGAAGFERLHEDVLAELVRAENVVSAVERVGLRLCVGEDLVGKWGAVAAFVGDAANDEIEQAFCRAAADGNAAGFQCADEEVNADNTERDDAGAVGTEARGGAAPAFATGGAGEHRGDAAEAEDEEDILREPVGEDVHFS